MDALARLRMKAGFQTQKELAETLGVQRVTISRWENGHRQPRLEMIAQLARLLKVPQEEVIQAMHEVKKQVNPTDMGNS